MAVKFDPETGQMILEDSAVNACPTDPDELNQCEGCQ